METVRVEERQSEKRGRDSEKRVRESRQEKE